MVEALFLVGAASCLVGGVFVKDDLAAFACLIGGLGLLGLAIFG